MFICLGAYNETVPARNIFIDNPGKYDGKIFFMKFKFLNYLMI